jgi:hypothetical protein
VCSYSAEKPDSALTLVVVFHNYATRYGVYMRHTAMTMMQNVAFFENAGSAFYGNAPLSIHTSVFDCLKPMGPIDEDTVSWNYRVAIKTWNLRVPTGCPMNDFPEEGDNVALLERVSGDGEDELALLLFNSTARLARLDSPSPRSILHRSVVRRTQRNTQTSAMSLS